MANSIFSILPPLLAIVMVILTRRVLLSLGLGIVTSALLLAIDTQEGFVPVLLGMIQKIVETVKGIFFDGGQINTWNVFIILFLILLGVITAFISISGGSRAFGRWAIQRVKTKAGAQVVTAIMGIVIFIDDYFNALAVGQISKPITDEQKVPRAKLAYIIDSTSAPICVVSPISSWGAYIISLIVPILLANEITDYTAFTAFIQMIPMNLYVWSALLLVFLVAIRNINIGPMKWHENRAEKFGLVHDPEKTAPGELKEDLPVSENGRVRDLIWPIFALMFGTIGAMIWTGYESAGSGASLLAIFENTDVAKSLVIGGVIGLIVTIGIFFTHVSEKDMGGKVLFKGFVAGTKSMLPAISILLFAWTIASLIGELQTGEYLAGIVENSNLNIACLPVILFLVAGIMAFSTGTSWGSFGILLPIAGTIAAATNVELLLPSMAAVLAGSVFGDHCSPISDTTILSSTGASCHHIDHVITQLPYSLVAAIASMIGYVIIGFTGLIWIGLVSSLLFVILFTIFVSKKTSVSVNKGLQHE
ncbi:Na+/H+ antiporter NhaC family protein [Fervidibacillus halotolerans]|uniref:Na+/H+ antiporter NhaC family protein n=1 Tax=Fervidibacillus halotolerans TaxID=2980027 RepID=A0A9E8LZ16_9BACI|nr:Na+/H+ antiporter NhaC family protein [Fervidibacillus halotolerans]WAA11900.1 Na+/H+ antiporter NhaC family protein [Fervidibacillus halotolerans]